MVMAHLGGKLLVFQSSAPSLGIGKVKNRDVANLYNTEREPTIRQPEDGFYKRYEPQTEWQASLFEGMTTDYPSVPP